MVNTVENGTHKYSGNILKNNPDDDSLVIHFSGPQNFPTHVPLPEELNDGLEVGMKVAGTCTVRQEERPLGDTIVTIETVQPI